MSHDEFQSPKAVGGAQWSMYTINAVKRAIDRSSGTYESGGSRCEPIVVLIFSAGQVSSPLLWTLTLVNLEWLCDAKGDSDETPL